MLKKALEVLVNLIENIEITGNMPLINLANEIRKEPSPAKTREEYRNAVLEFPESFNNFSAKDSKELFEFIYCGGFEYLTEIANKYCNSLNHPNLQSAQNIEKRAETIKFICKWGTKYSAEELEQEKEIKNKYPWHWFDSMENISRSFAREFAIEQIKKEGKINNFITRLDNYCENHGEPQTMKLLEEIYQYIPESDNKIIKNYFKLKEEERAKYSDENNLK